MSGSNCNILRVSVKAGLWTGLDWTGLWTGLDSGLDWTGLDWTGLWTIRVRIAHAH